MSSLAEIDRLLQEDRSAEALALVEREWQPDMLSAARHHALASRAMVASYTIADYGAAVVWLERTRKHAGAEAQPYLALLFAAFQRLDALTEALGRAAG